MLIESAYFLTLPLADVVPFPSTDPTAMTNFDPTNAYLPYFFLLVSNSLLAPPGSVGFVCSDIKC
jgi:hypothetical protein